MTPTNVHFEQQTTGATGVGTAAEGHVAARDHSPHLVHHFDSMSQQYEAAKLGMWLFLATEVLLFGGLFCAYAVFRGNHPALFAWGSQFLDVRYGAINTIVLIGSSITMATAVTCAQLDRRWAGILALSATFLCGVMFLAIKSVEYQHKFHENLVWGVKFYEIPEHAQGAAETGTAAEAIVGDPAIGAQLWLATCRSCHGLAGEGVTGQGKDIRSSEFILSREDSELLAFIKVGRMPFDPLNTTGIQMPPKGGNPLLKDRDLIDILAYIRSFLIPDVQEEPDDVATTDVPAEIAADDTRAPAPAEEEFWIPRSSIPLATSGQAGLDFVALAAMEGSTRFPENSATSPVHHSVDPDRPANAHHFFGLYFLMTGLHALHVLAGMGLIAWLILRSVWGQFGRAYYTPLDLGGLYWHIVDIIWIFLFPLFYLIR